VDYHLVPEEVKVHPVVTAAAFFTPEDLPVKRTAFFKVVNGDGYVERGYVLHGFLWFLTPVKIQN
jgi:hypothetical protein